MKKNHQFFIQIFGFMLLVFFLASCSTQKSFYQKGSGLDYLRFPLLEPYYAIKISEEYGWQIPTNTDPSKRNFRYYPDILNVTKIAVENSTIMVFSTYSKPIEIVPGEQKKELHWFILIPYKVETGYETEEAFNIGLQQYGLNQPQWQEPLSLLQKFDKTGCLEWIPDCK